MCEIEFGDFTPEEKKEYYSIRNTKRKNTESQNKKERAERYANIKKQRDKLIKYVFSVNQALTNRDLADMLEHELSEEAIRLIKIGER